MESTDTEAVVLLEGERHHLLGHGPEVPVPKQMLRPERWAAPGGPSAPAEVTVVGEGRSQLGTLVAVEWLCVDSCAAGIPVCAWTARYRTATRDWEALAVVPGRVAVKPLPASGPERAVRFVDEAKPAEHRVGLDCMASALGPFERVTCRDANKAYLRWRGGVVARAWEDYGEVSLRVLGCLDDDTIEAWLVRTSAKFDFSTSWLCRRGEEFYRVAGGSGRLGGGICDGDAEIAVLNPRTGRTDPRPNEGGQPFWYAVVDRGGQAPVAPSAGAASSSTTTRASADNVSSWP